MSEAENTGRKKVKIAFFFSHPTQHHAPWFQKLAARDDVLLKVFFMSRLGLEKAIDQEFKEEIQWDIPLVAGYEHEFLPLGPGLSKDYLGLLLYNRGYGRALGQTDWDAVCNMGYSSLGNWIIWALCRWRGVPQVYHSDSTLRQERRWWRQVFKELPIRLFFRGIGIFLSSGDNNTEYLRRYGVAPGKITLCPIPIDLERFRKYESAPDWDSRRQAIRKKIGLSLEDKVVVFCGKIIARKRPQDLVEALQKMTMPSVKALYIGTGPLADSIKKSLPDKVIVTGFINQQEIPYYLGLGDVLVMPSSYDAHPIVVSEAAALGLPAIISDRCGCYGPHDILRPGENGFVYPCANTDALAELLDLVLSEDSLRDKMSARARELAKTQDTATAAQAVVEAVRKYLQKKA
jgi:glycosyltransferase involved in cell wall biosynthesis